MRLDGIHHITAICADAQANLDYYSGFLGLDLVKKTVNFDAPDIYHLYYGDKNGSPGTILTFFEFPGVERGTTGPGMVDRIFWEVSDGRALDRWESRLSAEGIAVQRTEDELHWEDPEGLRLGLAVDPEARDIDHLERFRGVDANIDPARSQPLLTEVMGFTGDEQRVKVGRSLLDLTASAGPSVQGAGTVHHIAWACETEEQSAWKQRIEDAGAVVTQIIDRQYFFSIYFREPSGVLFEIATKGPGFAVDEPPERLGESLCLPPRYESMREQLEATLKPLSDPKRSQKTGA